MGYSPWGRKSRTRLSNKTTTTYTLTCSRKLFRQLLMQQQQQKCIALSQFSWKNSLLSKQPRYYLCKFLILAVQPFSLVAVCRLLTAVASLSGAWVLGTDFSSCGTWAQWLCLRGSRAQAQRASWLHRMWDLPRPEMEPMSPAFTIESTGKPKGSVLLNKNTEVRPSLLNTVTPQCHQESRLILSFCPTTLSL